ncbi:MAG: SRPBCC domain-containing protein [Acidimicrobiia bacterium]|nr:SRPBCC domain-containing protein [Acidimicrobiia bacterium]
MDLPRIERNAWLPAEPVAVWKHLTDGSLLETWFGGSVTIAVRRGGRITFDPGSGPLRWGTVEDLTAPDHVQWTWRTDDGEPSLVRIELDPEDGGTRLTVTEELLRFRMDLYPAITT